MPFNQKTIIIQWLFIAFMLLSCQDNGTRTVAEPLSILSPDSSLHLINGVLFYGETLFNGQLREIWPNGKLKAIRHMANGKEQGLSETYYSNGERESSRWYVNGEKDGLHTGWWENGQKKYEYHFKNGNYDSTFTEWYQSGNLIQRVMYANGKELYGKGWRENGKLYMNFIMKDGRRYGMNNSNLCYGLKDEQVADTKNK